MTTRTPLFHAEHSDRYDRQSLIQEYENLTGARTLRPKDAALKKWTS